MENGEKDNLKRHWQFVSLTKPHRTSNPLYDPAAFNDALRRIDDFPALNIVCLLNVFTS
jgi:hypothetical protein